MKITLTDRDGIRFDIDTILIEEVHGSANGTEVILSTGEAILCKESASLVMKMCVDAKFGGRV